MHDPVMCFIIAETSLNFLSLPTHLPNWLKKPSLCNLKFISYLDAVLEDVARTGEAAASLVHKLLTEDDDLFKEKNSSIAKLQLVCLAATANLRNKQAVLQQ